MVQILVCVKRVPDTAASITLTPDGLDVDDSRLGHTVSPHEECATALAVEAAGETEGAATVLSFGSSDAVEQLRDALAVGCTDAIMIENHEPGYGPADVAAAIAEVVTQRAVEGTTYDLVLVGNDAADTGDFQVGVRLAYALDRPVLTGIQTCDVGEDSVVARGVGPVGTEVFEVPLPAVLAISEGGIEPSYPTIPGRMKAKRAPIDSVEYDGEIIGNGRVKLTLPPEQPSDVRILGHGSDAAPAVVDVLSEIAVMPR